jgi:hypothetical protein
MAGKGYTVGIASETKAFKQGIDSGIIAPVEDAEKALDALGRAKGLDQLERGMSDAQDATEDLADETKDAARTIEREFRDGYGSMKRDADRSLDGATKATEGLKDEAAQTGREMAASFKEPADALDAVQELAANALSGLGPAGVIAGTAAAVGIGVVTEVLQTQQEEADKLKEKMAGMYSEAVEAGRDYLDEAQIIKGVNDILFDPENDSIYQQAKRDAETLGVTVSDVLRAQAGDQEKVNVLIEAGRQAAEDAIDPKQGSLDITLKEAAELGHTIERYDTLKGLHEENNTRAERSLEIAEQLGVEESKNQETARTAAEERGTALQNYADKAASIPNPVLVPTMDTTKVDREFEALKNRLRSPINPLVVDVIYKDPTGKFNP